MLHLKKSKTNEQTLRSLVSKLEMIKEDLIPTQQIGKQTDAEQEKLFTSSKAANEAYFLAMAKLLDVNAWQKISANEACSFQLFDRHGKLHHHTAKESDYIRFEITGTNTQRSNGINWVCIEYMECYAQRATDTEFTLFVTRPAKAPDRMGKQIDHFFTDKATATFIVFRSGNLLTAGVYGRNEIANITPNAEANKDNDGVYNDDSPGRLLYVQWQLLLAGILA